jgi:hypothetical protein
MPPPWVFITVILGGLAALIWFNPLNFSSIADTLGAIIGIACAGSIIVVLLWGIVKGLIAYFQNLRIALPATAATALVGTVIWQLFDGLGPAGKFVMIAAVVIIVFLAGIIWQS